MEMNSFSMEDERAIKALVFRYAYAVSRADGDALETTWAKNCRFELAAVTGESKVIEGREAVVGYQREHMGWYESLVQLVGQGLVWAGLAGIEGQWLVWEVGRRSGADNDRMGIVAYNDRYLHEDGRWVIADRRLKVHYNVSGLPPGAYAPLPPLPPEARA